MEYNIQTLLRKWQESKAYRWGQALAVAGIVLAISIPLYQLTAKIPTIMGMGAVFIASLLISFIMLWLNKIVRRAFYAHQICYQLEKSGVEPSLLLESSTQDDNRIVLGEIFSNLPLRKGEIITAEYLGSRQGHAELRTIARAHATVLLELFRILGLLEKVGNKSYSPVSEHAGALLVSIGYCIRQNVSILSNWRTRDVGEPTFQRARNFVQMVEDHRRECTPVNSWRPVREAIPVSIVIIKALRNGVDHVLLRWSGGWSNFNWIGGVQEPGDQGPESCAWRELNEELGIERRREVSMSHIGTVRSEAIMSPRVGVFTTWEFNVYTLSFNVDNPDEVPKFLDKLIPIEASFEVLSNDHRLSRTKWVAWKAIESDADFAGYGRALQSFIVGRFGGIRPSFLFDLGGESVSDHRMSE